ncbi:MULTISPECIES: anti-repressor SinI family protein [Metabacillus]|jgi:DNA-binding transcriptional MerR regulator|uniref:DNA-binding anti-repressor SinI n=1 Tax=Metabacillus elymi TaxID=2745198 RepID=A0ABX6RYJ8_9BACI|nr:MULTISPECIES: anti-repressor SinI family protein [Metabacillus]QNF26207.1 DNA-binding anti-repressor SinI [Metabacillus sp. KUDC1714]
MSKVKETIQFNQLDQEWIELMMEAKKLGLSFDEIKQFLHHGKDWK